MTIAAAVILAFIACAAGVYLFRRIASGSMLLLDVPNERSSHTRPVVRGAGLAIVLTILVGYLITTGRDANLVFAAAAGAIATISFIDDLRSIPFLPRLAVHFIAAAALVYWSGGYPGIAIPLFGSGYEFGVAGPFISVLFIVWTTNAFNFMDGIDGIAGVQGAGAGLGWMLFGVASGQPMIAVLGAIITGACLGFLLFNWQPASVFMGDVGSTFLGFTLASFPLFVSDHSVGFSRAEGLWLAATFLWLFLFDTVFTRLRQIIKLRPFWRAHREHLYQLAVIGGASHRSVTAFFGVFVLFVAVTTVLGSIGQMVLIPLLVTGPIALTMFAWKKRLT